VSERPLPDGLRFVGYLNRKPYLWIVDLATRTVHATHATLGSIPQGIDTLVPVDDWVAIACGPRWYRLEADLAGDLRPLSEAEVEAANQRRPDIPDAVHWTGTSDLLLPQPGDSDLVARHPAVKYWYGFCRYSPSRDLIAATASLEPAPPVGSYEDASRRGDHPARSALCLVDPVTGAVRLFRETFEGFGLPAWSADGRWIVIHAPFEAKKLYTAHRDDGDITAVAFKREPPTPLLDASLLGPLARQATS
jgi:hypothetical protein